MKESGFFEPIVQKGDGFEQESFLVEVRAIAGDSGSPVFLVTLFPQPDVSRQCLLTIVLFEINYRCYTRGKPQEYET